MRWYSESEWALEEWVRLWPRKGERKASLVVGVNFWSRLLARDDEVAVRIELMVLVRKA